MLFEDLLYGPSLGGVASQRLILLFQEYSFYLLLLQVISQ
jgi:hypothetical protein